jgi:hypothetical protein
MWMNRTITAFATSGAFEEFDPTCRSVILNVIGLQYSSCMPNVETITAIESYRGRCEDRVAVFNAVERTVIVVADGAGGAGSGDIAAESVVREIETEFPRIHSADQWAETLRQIDCRISPGESTAVIVDIRPYGIAGASVGDTEAWIINDGQIFDLTKTKIENRCSVQGPLHQYHSWPPNSMVY